MIHRAIAIVATLLFTAALPFGAEAVAQDQPPVHSKQEVARTKFRDLTDRMQELMVVLQRDESDPAAQADAGVLRAASQYVQEEKLHIRMDRCRTLLAKERWDDALVEIDAVREKLVRLKEILQNRDEELRKLLERMAQLQDFKGQVDALAKEQAQEKEDSVRTEALQDLLRDIEAQKQQVGELLAQQQSLRRQTNALGMQAAAGAAKPLEAKEGELKAQTEKVAQELGELEEKNDDLEMGKDDAAKPGESKPGESKPGESKPGEAKPGEAGKPGQAGKSGKGSCGKSASKAASAMGKAQEKLGQNQPESSLKDQDHAIENLKKAMEDLEAMEEEARRELLKLPFEEQAKRQEATKHATDTLSKEMEKAEESGENGEGEQTPGKKQVQQAVPKQRAAAGMLKEYKNAKQKQQDAKEDLEAASRELEEALAQLRQQLQDEVLRALEERFTAMLAVQRELTLTTKTLDAARRNVLTADGSLPTALRKKIAAVAAGEGDLEVEASDALKLLEEEGSTAVFPEMTMILRDQLHDVAARCRRDETGPVVQAAQKEVEETLELLINSLRKTMEKKAGGG